MSALVGFVLGLLLGLFLASTLAQAHGDAAWINKMQLGCCGATDCQRVPDGTWEREGRGYRSTVTGEFVFDAAAKASIDGGFWECRYGNGALRRVIAAEGGMCLFVPAIGF